MKAELINRESIKYLFKYPFTKDSLFRSNQDIFVNKCSEYAKKSVIEIGSEDQYGYEFCFRNIEFKRTNPFREDLEKLDVTNIKYENDSIDNFLCISVLEHVLNLEKL